MKYKHIHKKEVFKIFKDTISDRNEPTAIDIPFSMEVTEITSFYTQVYYEEDYDEEINKMVNGRVCYNGNNYEFNEAISPLIMNTENPYEALIECATLLFKFLKARALEAIEDDELLLAIGYIHSLNSQAHYIDRATNDNKMQKDVTLVDLNEQLVWLEDWCHCNYYEVYDEVYDEDEEA